MVKILMGLAAVVVIAVGGFFGFEFYAQHRVASEIETAFEQIRAGGGKASHGKVSFDARSRTVRIVDIATELATQPPVSVKIASVTAAGVGQPDAGRFSADSIEASDFEIGGSFDGTAGGRISYKMPRLEMKDYSGPASLPARPASASIIDAYRSGAGAVCRRLRVFDYGAHDRRNHEQFRRGDVGANSPIPASRCARSRTARSRQRRSSAMPSRPAPSRRASPTN